MIELELFFEKATAAIRKEQAEYLKAQKAQPFAQELPPVEELSAEAFAKLTFSQRWRYRRELRKQKKAYEKALKRQKSPVDERLTRGYNAGIEIALRVLEREFKAYKVRLEKEDN